MGIVKRLLGWAVLVSSLALLSAGCAYDVKSIDAHDAAINRNPPAAGNHGDPYAYGGTAMASGGTKTLTTFASAKPKIGGPY